MKRTSMVGLAVGVLVAVPLTACGGGTRESGDQGGAKAPGKAAAKPWSEGRLKKAALREGSTAGGYIVSLPVSEEPSYDDLGYTASKRVCQPLVSLAEGATETDPVATVNRAADPFESDSGPKLTAPSVDIQLRSYRGGDAETVMQALRDATDACGDGFTEDRTLSSAPVRSVEEIDGPRVAEEADESVSVRLRVEDVKDEDIVFTEYLTVVRVGTQTASFRLESLDQKDHGPLPAALVQAQVANLT
ncbi:hypothetical protein [Streptomyces sp. MAR4 CNX-425]|uniref:hypothetical protein n=1 Tax=Streptomyces sp. MAR4 CNX-425 TaxID=3406343 RepID=UPI003B505627